MHTKGFIDATENYLPRLTTWINDKITFWQTNLGSNLLQKGHTSKNVLLLWLILNKKLKWVNRRLVNQIMKIGILIETGTVLIIKFLMATIRDVTFAFSRGTFHFLIAQVLRHLKIRLVSNFYCKILFVCVV